MPKPITTPSAVHRALQLTRGLSLSVLMLALLTGCGGGGAESTSAGAAPSATSASSAASAGTPSATPAAGTSATRVSVGEAIFNDTALSASGRQACASCHAKPNGRADASGTTLPLGGPLLDRQGLRSSPSLMYLTDNGAFRLRPDGTAVGGFTWDGRADNRQAQAAGPLLDASEMANVSVADVAAKVRRASYFADLSRLFELAAAASDQQVFDTVTQALAIYQAEDPDYALFNSKFDRVQDGSASFSAAEARGQAVFNDPDRGNCASCHSSRIGPQGQRPLFTNFTYAALGLPRNPAIAANADANFFDLGLCGPKRTDLSHRTELCGQFKVPTLRNIAVSAPYFHNGAIATLEEAVSFYATRDIDPARWYPRVAGVPEVFNDLPPGLRGNVIRSAPFGSGPGARPRLSAQDVADIVAFLRTLSDDFSAPAANATVMR